MDYTGGAGDVDLSEMDPGSFDYHQARLNFLISVKKLDQKSLQVNDIIKWTQNTHLYELYDERYVYFCAFGTSRIYAYSGSVIIVRLFARPIIMPAPFRLVRTSSILTTIRLPHRRRLHRSRARILWYRV